MKSILSIFIPVFPDMATVTVRNILATAVVALTLSSCIRDRIPQGADLQPGDRLPDFSVIMSDGTSFSSADLDGKVSLMAMATDGAVKKGAHAGNLIKAVAGLVGGGGGGRPNMAQAGGKNPEGMEAAVAKVPEVLKEQLS